MKKPYLPLLFLLSVFGFHNSDATVWNVTNSGFTFSPNVITITLGDTVMFNLASQHNAQEVSQATWNANQNTSNGGFVTPFGGGMVIPTTVKTYYYVCQPHASLGMKGQIIVNSSTGIPIVESSDGILKFQPNPASALTKIHTGLPSGISNNLNIYDLSGKSMLSISNISNDQSVDISFLRNGIYFIELNAEGYRRTSKLIVGH